MSGLIIQANLHHFKSATDRLVHDMLLAKCQVIALIQEPYLGKGNYTVGIPKNFGCYHQGAGVRGRSSILTKGCNLLLCPGYTGQDIVTCQLHMGTGEEAFGVSAYCDITINHVPLELVRLLEDKNDITLCTSGMFKYISRWKVDTRDHLSDHRRINFRLDMEAQAQPSQVWATKKADWCKFFTLMGDRSSNFRPHRFWAAKTLDREIRHLYHDLRYCISKVCLMIKVRRRQTNPWWNADLSSQRSKVRHLQQ